MLCTHGWATARKVHRLTVASANGCWACCSRQTGTVLWKRNEVVLIFYVL